MVRVVVAHRGERFCKPVFSFAVEVRSRGKHAMVVSRRRPYLAKGAFRHEMFLAHGVPEGAPYRAGIGSPVEDGAHNFNFAGSRIAMFAEVGVETQRAIIDSLSHALLP